MTLYLHHATLGVPLWQFFGSMVILTVIGYWMDHLDGKRSGPTAFFIDNKTRKSSVTTTFDKFRYWLKNILLCLSLYIEYDILFNSIQERRMVQLSALREWLCLLCGSLFIGRVLVQMMVFHSVKVSWVQVFAESGIVIPLTLASFATGAVTKQQQPVSWMEFLGLAVFLVGSFLNLWPEYTRHVWKSDPRNKGRLYVEGLFRFCRHINYFGEVLSFVGFALVTAALWNLWVPAVMGVGMALVSVPELDAYLARKYHIEWDAYTKAVTCQMFPGMW